MVDPKTVCFFIPANLKKFKLALFERIADHIAKAGGKIVKHKPEQLDAMPPEVIPIVGCSIELSSRIHEWMRTKRNFIYWDRSYARRVFATWLPRGENGGFYRWHVNSFQLQKLRSCQDDRWKALQTEVGQWAKNGKHIVVAVPTPTYSAFHKIEGWTDNTIRALALLTDRQIVVRDKESKRPLGEDLKGAHCLVAHGSNAAVEAVIMGCPVFVDQSSAAALVGKTDLSEIERPVYPDRQQWLNALSYSQFNETELVDGTLWRLLQ